MDQLEGETIGRMLDFLDKEMVRLLDERKIHALMLLAERDRRMREATEAGRRQREEEERRVNDEIFRQVRIICVVVCCINENDIIKAFVEC